MTEQLAFAALGRCGYVRHRTEPDRAGDQHAYACTLAPHADDVAHRLEWVPVPRAHPVQLVVIQGGAL